MRLAGKILSQLAPLRAMSIAVTEKVAQGGSPIVEGGFVKDLGTAARAVDSGCDRRRPVIARRRGEVPPELLLTLNYITQVAPSFSLRGGTRDILRGMIARGLGLR